MKKLIAVAAIAGLAACAEPATEEATEEVAVEEAAPAVGGPGTYEVTWSDGAVSTMTTKEDGTWSATRGNESATGTVEDVDGKACFDTDGDDEGAMCWTASEPAEDGSWTSTSDDGQVVTVRPVAAAETADAEA